MYACIDLGSNSFHLLIGEWLDGRIEIIERCSEKVQLGESVHATGKISAVAFQRGILCLQKFKSLMDQYPLQRYWALGTNTFRVTDNADEFILSAKEVGIDISIISGVQEAVLIYAGVITALSVQEAHRLIIDIGGGSTEIIVGKQHTRLLTESMAIGSVAWRDQFFANSITDKIQLERQLDAAVVAARQVFSRVAPGVSKAGWTEAYASSGTVKMLASICAAHGYTQGKIELQALQQLKEKILSNIANGTELPGLKERRRDLLLAGWCVLVGLMETYSIESINFSATALREGMLDFMVKNKKTIGAMETSGLPAVSYTKT
ncbi:MAG: hypothetical protein HQ498_15520 [Pseudohongiella sp.]|nr:hypothetical protein [Pseudohongiella sp.]